MSYELHIERLGQNKHGEAIPIPLDAWKAAVSATPGVRLCTPGIRKITYPHGASINFPIQDGDLEVYFPEEQAWEPVFHWRDGSASVNASFDPGDSSQPVWTAMVALASRLGAAIRGDDGECYDLQTGEVTDAYERSGVDPGTALCLHIRRLRPGATHPERWAFSAPRPYG